MTYIEFFDENASENIISCLTQIPDRVIYIGDNAKVIKRNIDYYNRVFSDRGENIEFLHRTFAKNNLENAIELLTELVETYDDCVFDITGGDEALVFALGIVYARHPERNIQIHKFNLRNSAIYDYDKDGQTIYKEEPILSVEENVRIHGGDVIYGGVSEEKTYKWNLSPDFVNDVNLIWNVCKSNVRNWNAIIGVFNAIESIGETSDDGLTSIASKAAVDEFLSRYRAKYKVSKWVIDYLLEHKLLTSFDDGDDDKVTISYKNDQVKKCLTKAGLALELKIYISAKETLDSSGEPVYKDAVNGVVIDWDGVSHSENEDDSYDTENEIDILLMHDTVPVFISCKNGIVTADELYKLNTVAERFGGQQAKKILVATAISSLGDSGNYLLQRAKDMDIKVLDDVQNLDDDALAKKLKNLWCS